MTYKMKSAYLGRTLVLPTCLRDTKKDGWFYQELLLVAVSTFNGHV